MKKLLLFLSICCYSLIHAQDLCGTDAKHHQLLTADPAYAQRLQKFDANSHNVNLSRSTAATPNYVIPVVMHIMHKGEAVGTGTNVSDAAIKDQIRRLNLAYRKKNGGNGVDTGIEFALAVRNPQGGCTNGIDRVNMTSVPAYMNNGVAYGTANGISDTMLKSISAWDSNLYYNIWIISEFDNGASGVAGYAYFASAHGQAIDGAVILASQIVDPGSVTVEHELGHALNLYHTFEGDNNGTKCPPVVNGCGSEQGDCCADTAPHIRFTNCNTTTSNSCAPGNPNLDYTHNYMTYSSVGGCTDMFTQDQADRMESALTSIRGSLLAKNGNRSLVPPSAPSPDFAVNPAISCRAGQSIKLTDMSSCVPNTFMDETAWPGITFTWTLTNGTNTYTATGQNPQLVIPAAGTYRISLRITTPAGAGTTTRRQAFIVAPSAPPAACTPRAGQMGNFGYTLNRVTFNDIDYATSATLNGNYQDLACTFSTIVTPGTTYPLVLSLSSGSQYAEIYRVYIDYNNNGIFENAELVASGSNPAATSRIYISDITIPQTAVRNTLLRMRAIGEADNLSDAEISCSTDYFVGDIEDYGVYIAGTLDTDTIQPESLNVYPNPVTDILSIKSSMVITTAKFYNILGQLMMEKQLNAADTTLDISVLSSGTYLVQATAGDKTQTFKIIKQ